MPHDHPDNRKKPLVSVEFQTEVDVATGRSERRMFLKMYFDARDSGLLAALPAELWKTLCCLATYMDENGFCYPSQARLAKDLGISRQKTNARIQRLLAFRFQGLPVLNVTKTRRATAGGGRWGNNVYQLRPITGFAIFGGKPPVSPQGDIGMPGPMSPQRDTREGDTNQNHSLNQIHTGVSDSQEEKTAHRKLVAYFHSKAGHSAVQPTPKELNQAKAILVENPEPAARFIVDFALEKARETNFRMRHFGAVLGYAAEALEHHKRAAVRSRREEADRRGRREEDLALRSAPRNVNGLLTLKIGRFKLDHGREPTAAEVDDLRRSLATADRSQSSRNA